MKQIATPPEPTPAAGVRASFAGLPVLTLLAAVFLTGCQDMPSFSKLNPFGDPNEAVVENVKDALSGKEGHSRLVGDYITVRSGLQMYMIEGVGLVTGLDGTGSNPGPPHRQMLLDDMRKRSFPRPEEFLDSSERSLVLVRAYVPPLIRKGDRIDVEVRVPDGSGTTSLRGGVLLACSLTELAYARGRGLMEGKVLAHAEGAILNADLGDGSDGNFLRGYIPGGAVYSGADRDLSVQLLRDYANYRMSTRIATRVGQRFHDYDRSGIQRPMAEAKTDSRITLQVHRRYADNYPRYLQCIRHIQLRESSVERNLRMTRLGEQLLNGQSPQTTALELEAIGLDAVPALKSALQSESAEARFHAAQSLAYLGDESGVTVLAETVAKEPAFRVYALAALAATGGPSAVIALQPLMNSESLETRYGAFRAITTIAAQDPIVAGSRMKGGYMLHAIPSKQNPVVHFTQRKKCEIVLFGREQTFITPMVVRAGQHIMIRSNPTGDRLIITRIASGMPSLRQEVSTQVLDVIQTLDEMGARYPDVVQMLVEAERQGNLPGRLGIDALPRAGRAYQPMGTSSTPGQADESSDTPNGFDTRDPSLRAVEGPIDPEDDIEDNSSPESFNPVGFEVQ